MKKYVMFSKDLCLLNFIRLSVATGRRGKIELFFFNSLICFAVVIARSSTEEECLKNRSLYPSGVVVVQTPASGKTRQLLHLLTVPKT
jgi:hypothetical protein